MLSQRWLFPVAPDAFPHVVEAVTPDQTIRVLVAEDDPALREVLAELIAEEPHCELVSEARDAQEAIELATRDRPDVALVDVQMPRGGGRTAARGILDCSPTTRVLAFSAHEDRQSILGMLKAGAAGYIVKGATATEIIRGIRDAADGLGALSGSAATEVVDELTAGLRQKDTSEARFQQIHERIRWALREPGAFTMAFQPIMALEAGRIVGVEALARFSGVHTRTPDVWFSEAAEVGLHVELELAAARKALSSLVEIPDHIWLSVNLSPESLLSPAFDEILEATRPERIIVELTEHARIDDYARLAESLGRLRTAGGRVAVDDAGAGFASLRHILDLTPDFIKLDNTLTRDIDKHQPRHALARALITFCSDIGSTLVAEGIETAAEMQALRALGVTHGQGYHLGRPGPLPEIMPGYRDSTERKKSG